MAILVLVICLLTAVPPMGSITITGSSTVEEKDLRSAMLLREPGLFRRPKFYPEILDGDVQALRSVYISRGFLEPTISSEYSADSTGQVHVIISINEGKQTMVESVSFAGNKLLRDEALKALIETKSDLPFNPFALESDYLVVINEYDARGYHDASVTADVDLLEGARIIYQISEGERIHVSKVATEGVPSISKERLGIAIGMRTGTVLTNKTIAEGRKRLHDLGIFSRIRVREEDTVFGRRVVFQLEPREPITLGLRLGYSTLDGPKTNLTVRHNNLFNSLRRGTVVGKVSLRERSLEANYVDPVTSGRWVEKGFGVKGAQRSEIGYATDRVGAYITLVPRPFSMRYDVEWVKVSNEELEGIPEETKEWLRTLTLSLTVDRRDSPVRPRNGSLIASHSRFAGLLPEAESNFISNESRYRRFAPLSRATIGFRFDVGIAEPFSPTKEVPIHSRFFLGGATTVRGYVERGLGPKDSSGDPLGGESYYVSSLEARVPIFWLVSVAGFLDVGALGEEVSQEELSPKTAVGAGIRVHTPIGPVRFDYARNSDGSGAFHFAVGEAF